MSSRCKTCFYAHATHTGYMQACYIKGLLRRDSNSSFQASKFDSLLPQIWVNGKIKCCHLTFRLKKEKKESLEAIYSSDKHHLQEE